MSDFQQPNLQTFFNDCIHCELHCYNIADADDLATQRTRSSSAIALSHLTRNILFSTQQGKSEGFESCDRPIVRKRPIWVKIGDVLSRVTLKFDG